MPRDGLGVTSGLIVGGLTVTVATVAYGVYRFATSGEVLAAAIVFAGVVFTGGVTFAGLLFKRSIDQRHADLRDQEQDRLKLQSAVEALQLLGQPNSAPTATQRIGVLFTLMSLRQDSLTLRLLDNMLEDGSISSNSASDLFSHLLEPVDSRSVAFMIDVAEVLNRHCRRMLTPDGYNLPDTFAKWPQDQPAAVRRLLADALLQIMVMRPRAEWRAAIDIGFANILGAMWLKETDDTIRTGLGASLRLILSLHRGRHFVGDGVTSEFKADDVNTQIEAHLTKHTKISSGFTNRLPEVMKWVEAGRTIRGSLADGRTTG